MFDDLSENYSDFQNLRGEGKLTAENMDAALREIRVALLEADVNFRVVKQLIENIKQKAMERKYSVALSPSQQVIKIVRDELIKILGSHDPSCRFATTRLGGAITGLQGPVKPPPRASWRLAFPQRHARLWFRGRLPPAAREQLRSSAGHQLAVMPAPLKRPSRPICQGARRERSTAARRAAGGHAGRLHIGR